MGGGFVARKYVGGLSSPDSLFISDDVPTHLLFRIPPVVGGARVGKGDLCVVFSASVHSLGLTFIQ